MRFRKSRHDEPGLGITPLIDIVFLLLIFFILTSQSYIVSGLPITLPKMGQKASQKQVEKIHLVIDRKGDTFYNGKNRDLTFLFKEFKQVSKKDDRVRLFLEADKDVSHGRVVQVMDIAKRAGINAIVIAAQWEPQKVE